MKTKFILLVLLVAIFSGCNILNLTDDEKREILLQRMIGNHEIYYADFGDFSPEKSLDQQVLEVVNVMRENIKYATTPGEEETLPNPQVIWERGYGDCDCFAIVLMNILYVELGIRAQFVVTNLPDSSKAILNGGEVTHAAVLIDGKVYEPQVGYRTDYVIDYLYPFEFVFSADF